MEETEEKKGNYCSAIPEEIIGIRSDLEKINISSSPSVLTVVRQVKKLHLTVRSLSLEWIRIWNKK